MRTIHHRWAHVPLAVPIDSALLHVTWFRVDLIVYGNCLDKWLIVGSTWQSRGTIVEWGVVFCLLTSVVGFLVVSWTSMHPFGPFDPLGLANTEGAFYRKMEGQAWPPQAYNTRQQLRAGGNWRCYVSCNQQNC
jgi:hypothetical protein